MIHSQHTDAERQKALQEKADLLAEMLEITKDYDGFLKREPVDDNIEQVTPKTEAFLKTRAKLIDEINAIDKSLQNNQVSPATPPGEAEQRIVGLIKELIQLQTGIDSRLGQTQATLQRRVGKTRRSRNLVKGYYNQQVASRPRFIDDER